MTNFIRKTPLVKSEKYSEYSLNNVYLKSENLQVSGSIKIRALQQKFIDLKEQGYKKICLVSSGNTAKSAAMLAEKLDIKCEVVMPLNTSYTTIIDIKDHKTEVRLVGNNIEESRELFKNEKLNKDTYFLDLANDIDCSLAYASLVDEILEDLPSTQIILVPVGTGSLLNGVLEYVKKKKLDIAVYAVEPYNHPTLSKALENNGPVVLENHFSIAENINGKVISNKFFKNIKDNVKGVISVSDEELIDSSLDIVDENKMIVENSALLSLVGTKYLKEKKHDVVCLLTGGNVDITIMSTMFQVALEHKGRIFTFKTMLSDKPGELLKVASCISENEGNVMGIVHNQVLSISRQNKVGITFKVEAFGLAHKFKICTALENLGYEITLVEDHLGSDDYE